MKKKIIGGLVFVGLLLLLSTNALASNGVMNRINSIKAQFPSGTYFTANGQACNHLSGSTCSNCQLSSVLKARGIAFDSSKYTDGWTCYAFAVYCYGTIFEQNYIKAQGIVSSGVVSSNDGLYNAFKQAKPGDFVYCMNGENVNHYAIFISCDSNGVTLFHNNIGGNGKVGKISYGYVPYSNLRGAGYGYNRVDIYRASNYDSVNGPEDTQAPVITNVRISSITSESYTVSCTITDNVGVTSVKFPTWPSVDDSGNPIWHEGTINGNTASCVIRKSDHGNKKGTYVSHIYAYDAAGNSSSAAADAVELGDQTKPTIEDVYIKDVSSTGYTVHCIVRDNQALSHVSFPTWTSNTDASGNDQDDIIWGSAGDIAGAGWELNYRVNISDHNNEVNCWYHTHIYCYDLDGNVTSCIVESVFIENIKPIISDVRVTDITESGYTVSCVVTDEHSGVVRVQFPTWYENDNPYAYDSSWNTSSFCSGKLENGRYVYRVNISDYGNRFDNYYTDIYAWDGCGNQSKSYNTLTAITKTHKHEYTSNVKKSATCTQDGIMLYTCKEGDVSYEEAIPATGHQHTELRNVKEAACGQEGYTGDTYCKDCNIKLSSGKSIAKKSHTWDSGKITKEATCTVQGVKTYTCTICKTTKTEDVAATGHRNTEYRNNKAATCAQEGYTGDIYCTDCGTKLSSGKLVSKTDHTWDAGKVTQNGTCATKGIKTYICTVCGSTRIEEIPESGQKTKVTKFAKEVSCKSEGYTGDIYCQDCGELLEKGNVIPKTEHKWNSGEITKAATCTGEGTKTFTCTVCGTTRTETISVTGHGAVEARNEKSASCASEGYTGDTYCTVCNQKISSGSVLAKTDHFWDGGKITKQPTTAETGIKTYTCRNCGATRTEAIEKLKQQTAIPGKSLKDKSTNGVYKVLNDGLSVEFTKPVSKKASVRIPDIIKVNGVICKVSGISANAFKNNTSLKTVTIGKNVTTIGTNAFYGCKKLNKVSGGNGVVKIGNRAFANCRSLSSITIPGTVRSIGKQAFCNCKKLRAITIKTSALSSKTVGAKAFTGTYNKPTVKVPAKQMKAYKKFFKSRGMSSKAVYKK